MNTTVIDEKRGISWPDWQAQNRLQDLHGVASRAKLTKYAAMAALLLVLAFWGRAADYHTWLSFVVCACAIRVAFLAGAVRRFDWALLFIGVAVLYNPVFPIFALAGLSAFLLVMASITAFAASLFMPRSRPVSAFVGH